MDILFQLQSARKKKSFFVKLENVPYTTVCYYLSDFNFDDVMRFLSKVEDSLNDSFYLVGVFDAAFCNRKVLSTFSYSDFFRIACGPGE